LGSSNVRLLGVSTEHLAQVRHRKEEHLEVGQIEDAVEVVDRTLALHVGMMYVEAAISSVRCAHSRLLNGWIHSGATVPVFGDLQRLADLLDAGVRDQNVLGTQPLQARQVDADSRVVAVPWVGLHPHDRR